MNSSSDIFPFSGMLPIFNFSQSSFSINSQWDEKGGLSLDDLPQTAESILASCRLTSPLADRSLFCNCSLLSLKS